MYTDTNKEREISAAMAYKFDRLNEGECIIHQEIADDLLAEVGDIFFIKLDIRQNLREILKIYNKLTDDQIVVPPVPDSYA